MLLLPEKDFPLDAAYGQHLPWSSIELSCSPSCWVLHGFEHEKVLPVCHTAIQTWCGLISWWSLWWRPLHVRWRVRHGYWFLIHLLIGSRSHLSTFYLILSCPVMIGTIVRMQKIYTQPFWRMQFILTTVPYYLYCVTTSLFYPNLFHDIMIKLFGI